MKLRYFSMMLRVANLWILRSMLIGRVLKFLK